MIWIMSEAINRRVYYCLSTQITTVLSAKESTPHYKLLYLRTRVRSPGFIGSSLWISCIRPLEPNPKLRFVQGSSEEMMPSGHFLTPWRNCKDAYISGGESPRSLI